ncbi:MAG TPA: tail fiber domain-containing protein [Verrucomicrobiae bacterium]
MKISPLKALLALVVAGASNNLYAQGTVFTYQGCLNLNGAPAAGSYDFRFRVATDASGSSYVGGSAVINAVPVAKGLFVVGLDFGAGIFTGQDCWLQIEVKTNGAAGYATLVPLQPFTPTPYAMFAGSASNVSGTVSASQVSGGTLPGSVLPAGANFSGTVSAGWLSGNGAGVTGVNAAALNGLNSSNFWQTGGNTGSSPADGNFLGTKDNQPLELRVNNARALRLEPNTNGVPNLIGGSPANYIFPGVFGSTIGGGGTTNMGGFASSNSIAASYSTIGGGFGNTILASAYSVTIGGGNYNTIKTNCVYSIIAGGGQNQIGYTSSASSIGGGLNNTIGNLSGSATIAGGQGNSATNWGATVGGGGYDGSNYGGNVAGGAGSTVGGGISNKGLGTHSVISGGFLNNVFAGTTASTIAGGYANTIDLGSDDGFIGGGYWNRITNSTLSTIGGGYANSILAIPDSFLGISSASIAGGAGNSIGTNGLMAAIGGGYMNTANGLASAAAGGSYNVASGDYSFAVGYSNTISGDYSFAVGAVNSARGASSAAFGTNNIASGYGAVALGEACVAAGRDAVALGPYSTANGDFSIACGGAMAGGQYSTALGYTYAGGAYATSMGYLAQATGDGTFVWADRSGSYFGSTTNDEFSLRALNGVRIQTDKGIHLDAGDLPIITRDWDLFGKNAPIYKQGIGRWGLFMEPYNLTMGIPGADAGPRYFQIAKYSTNGTATQLVRVDQSGNIVAAGTVTANGVLLTSDRNAKENFKSLDAQTVLAKVLSLPVTEWNYKSDDAEQKHIGPMAQDFQAAFGLNGGDDKHISVVDESGVALAAIQGLNEKLQEQKAENAELKARLEKLERLLQVKRQ